METEGPDGLERRARGGDFSRVLEPGHEKLAMGGLTRLKSVFIYLLKTMLR